MKVFNFSIIVMLYYFCAMNSMAAEKSGAWKIPEKKNFHIFLLMGQSNMAGFGKLKPGDEKAVPYVLQQLNVGKPGWKPAAHPLHNRKPTDRFGLGLPFAKEYLKGKSGVVVGLIPVAVGGAPISGLRKGGVYADAMEKVHFALKQGTIKGILWHQGESDAINAKLAPRYEENLHGLIADCRKDIKDAMLPFIVGDLVDSWGVKGNAKKHAKNIALVRDVLRELPNKVKNTAFVESKDCSAAGVHFKRDGYITLGKRYAEAYKKIVK